MTQPMPDTSTVLSDDSSNPALECPMLERPALAAPLAPDEVLVFPKNKRVVVLYEKTASGAPELHLHYRAIEIVFDEPELFAFAETLVKQSRFVAVSALQWGADYTWPRIRELLEQLLESGVLRRAAFEPPCPAVAQGLVASPLPSAQSSEPRTWLECEAITRELTGSAVPLGYLELVVPLHRVAHSALDSDGRQVGEANVFPPALRVDVPTEWRVCQYPGSRFQDEFPMNVSALKSMIRHWQPMLVVLARLRAGYLARFARSEAGWTVGDIQRISCLAMGIAGYMLLRRNDPVSSGRLHPVFSSLARISDGVRMTASELLSSAGEGVPMSPDAPLTASELYAAAERNNLLLSTYGVCAAPRQLIEEFLDALFDGTEQTEPTALDPEVRAALSELEPAFDYGLYALQGYALASTTWMFGSRAYEQLLSRLQCASEADSRACAAFEARLRTDFAKLADNDLGSGAARSKQLDTYRELHASCERALHEPVRRPSPFELDQASDHTPAAFRAALSRQLLDRLRVSTALLNDLVATIAAYAAQEQRLVRAAFTAQRNVNRSLGRALPSRALTGADLALGHRLRHPASRLPYLMDALDEQLGIRIVVSSDAIELRD